MKIYSVFKALTTGLRIYWLSPLRRGKRCPGYDTKLHLETWSWRQTAILTHNFLITLYYLQSLRLLSLIRCTQLGTPCGPLALHQHDSLSARLNCQLTAARLTKSHVGICIYHFTTPTHFRSTTWLLPLIYTGASYAEKSLSLKCSCFLLLFCFVRWYLLLRKIISLKFVRVLIYIFL